MSEDPMVILTRENDDNIPIATRLKEVGIDTLLYPCIETDLIPYHNEPVEGLSIDRFDAVVFTSKRGVAGMKSAYPILAASRQVIAVVGPATAESVRTQIGRPPDLIANPSNSEALASQLAGILNPGSRILHVRGNKTTGSFKEIMQNRHIKVSELIVYQNQKPHLTPLPEAMTGLVLLASPSAVEAFCETNPDPQNRFIYLSIGSTTLLTLQKIRKKQLFESPATDIDSIVQEIKSIVSGGVTDPASGNPSDPASRNPSDHASGNPSCCVFSKGVRAAGGILKHNMEET